MPLLVEFNDFPEAKEGIGTILAAYGEIEFALMGLLAEALFDGEVQDALRVLFRVHGEGPRITVCDALLRKTFQKYDLGSKWELALGAIRLCKSIRNNYAHCHWQIRREKLCFLDLDLDARSRAEEISITWKIIDEPLVRHQVQYMGYALDLLYWLHSEVQKKAGRKSILALTEPKSIDAPRQYIQES
jgi:hypothetical protein